jgi:phosphatidylinositol alpha-1,6-mannosyltransferase
MAVHNTSTSADCPAMRILMLASQLGGRGGIQYAGRLVLRALREWAGPDADVTVLSLQDRPEDLVDFDLAGTTVAGEGNRVKSAWKAWRLIRQRHWDLVLLGHLHLAPLLALISPIELPPVVGLIYGIESWQRLTRLRRCGLQKAAKLLYISQHTRRTSEHWNPWLKRIPGEVCYLGLLPGDESSPAAGRLTGSIPGPYAVAIGRMARAEGYKGFEELIRVWPRVEQVHPGLKLVLIGDGSDRARLEALATDQQASVVFTGGVGDGRRDELLQNCAALCLPSRGEGFGLVYLEAMRLGKPVLAGSTDAGREVVADGVTGRAVSGLEPEELLAGILDVVGERGPLLGAAGRMRYVDHFSYGRFYERFSHEVESVVCGARSKRPLKHSVSIG